MQSYSCPNCHKLFTRAYNLKRHRERSNPCIYGEKVGTIMIQTPEMVRGRRQTPTEMRASLQARKNQYYTKNASTLRSKATIRARQRRGIRQGGIPKKNTRMSQQKQDELMWRRMIRAVHWRNMFENRIHQLACQLAEDWSPGDADVPLWVRTMYSAMKVIFRNHPEIWNSVENTWVQANFDWKDDHIETDSAVEAIYAPVRFNPAWGVGLPSPSLVE